MKKTILLILNILQKLHGFGSLGYNSVIKPPYKIWGHKNIFIGNNVFIAENSYILAITEHNGKTYYPKLQIGNNVCIGSNSHITCCKSIKIEDNVLISDRVFIGDHIHDYRDNNKSIMAQNLYSKGGVKIGRNSFIGINAVILPGVTIGKHAVIGASAVVTKNVPNYGIAIGNPARVVNQTK